MNQDDPNVWFLAGSFGTTEVRNCTIPKGRALFYPLIEGGWIDCPPPSTDSEISEAIIRQIIAIGKDYASSLTSTLDEAPISSLSSQILTVRTQSPVFKVNLPDDNVVGDAGCGQPTYPSGISGRQIIDGYWVMLPPLSSGKHVLTLHGAALGVPFENEVTYNLTVE
ncbi:MAG: hypothetical protein PSU93_15480 [Methylobacter sp.]|uniref:Uncharacterized protein n=1 Tax=Candidatus Methylobacter titanis TaxID=3053457 RepID=A0AA43Q6E1_9GAMM|nr:hypothetical protein [Candidatus Methylobacter titanis]